MNALIYARTSTIQQDIHTKVDTCSQWVKDNGGTVVKIYMDEGFSAHDTERPSLTQLIGEISDHKNTVDTLVVIQVSDLFRNSDNLIEFVTGLDQLGIKLVRLN
ncbi:recombinase family protein [Paenibacillus xylanexedens]|uniref:recombinase family protein n=1 Tax=Paenibacillus xylanexedens TaxID=528191 RepID=UPI0011A0ECE1|nr:recombinase family protein [Paenibacillus xylanexedens]